MKVKTSELDGDALNWAVAKAARIDLGWHYALGGFSWDPSNNWSQGGPIIEEAGISFREYYRPGTPGHGTFYARVCRESGQIVQWHRKTSSTGPTALIAAMRCYVRSELGEEIEVPDELLQ